jgi:hypothetical protein
MMTRPWKRRNKPPPLLAFSETEVLRRQGDDLVILATQRSIAVNRANGRKAEVACKLARALLFQ